MSEPRRSTRARAREEAAPPPPETPKETPSKPSAKSLKRKRLSTAVAKEATPGTPVPEGPQPPPQPVLPIRVTEGQPLPTLSEPQPLDLSTQEYQDIQTSGVLSASLQRSRAIWVSGTNFRLFHAFFTPPKKVADRTEEDKQNIQRQKEIVRNFPQVGEAQLVIEPHTFPIRLYGPREAARQVQKKAPTYGQWPNHNQQSPYQYNHTPVQHQPIPQPRPPPPKPQPQKAPPPPQAPAPDPVIHMLAQRAGQDPELKAVMKIVAAGQATKEQLEFFQGHISELTAILQKQKEAGIQPMPNPPPAPKPQATPRPQPPAPPRPTAPSPQQQPQQQPLQQPKPPQQQQPPPPPPPPPQQQQHQPPPPQHQPIQQHPPLQQHKPLQPPPNSVATPKQPIAMPPHAHQPQMAPTPPPASHPGHFQFKPNYNQPPQFHQHHAQQFSPMHQPPRITYRPLVFDFKEGNGDKFYFPTYSFMEWLPNNSGAKFSFLVTKLKTKPPPATSIKSVKPPSTPAPKAAPSPAAPSPAVPTNNAPTPTGPTTETPTPNPAPTPLTTPAPAQPTPTMAPPATPTPTPNPAAPPTPLTQATPYVPPPRIEDFDERKDIPDIDFYQPVTVLVMSGHPDILQSLPRAIRPPDVVDRYMNEIFDTCRRAEETFLAFRLPREGGPVAEVEEEKKGKASGDGGTPRVDDAGAEKKKASRSRKSIAA